MPDGKAFVVVKGDGRAVQGPCLVTDILWYCDKNNETCAIYDGLDATAGRLFHTLKGDADSCYLFGFGDGIEFSSGVYVDQTSTDDVATICFYSLDD